MRQACNPRPKRRSLPSINGSNGSTQPLDVVERAGAKSTSRRFFSIAPPRRLSAVAEKSCRQSALRSVLLPGFDPELASATRPGIALPCSQVSRPCVQAPKLRRRPLTEPLDMYTFVLIASGRRRLPCAPAPTLLRGSRQPAHTTTCIKLHNLHNDFHDFFAVNHKPTTTCGHIPPRTKNSPLRA